MQSPATCPHGVHRPNQQTFCGLLKDPKGMAVPCVVVQGRGDDCPLEHTMQSGDSSVIQQGDAGER